MPKNTSKRPPAPENDIKQRQAEIKEVERLAVAAVGYDNRDQSVAILELLTRLIPHDKSGYALKARLAVIRASDELADEAGDLLVEAARKAREQEARNGN